jgi:hypothetical protein
MEWFSISQKTSMASSIWTFPRDLGNRIRFKKASKELCYAQLIKSLQKIIINKEYNYDSS